MKHSAETKPVAATAGNEREITTIAFLEWWQQKVKGVFIENEDFDTINEQFYNNNKQKHGRVNALEEKLQPQLSGRV